MPRQRVTQSNVEPAYEAPGVKETEGATRSSSNEEVSSAGDKDESQVASEAANEKEREKGTSKYSEKVLDLSIKLKVRRRDIRVCVCVRLRGLCGDSSTTRR